ncbi:MAG: type II asparaginase [Rickettsiales bacterium]|nr:type II asparaginase [Rickettsiales bacterium]
MKILQTIFFSFLLLFSLNANAKNIAVIATGGTIAGVGGSATDAKYSPSTIDIDKIIKSVTGITDLAEIKAEQLLQVRSQDMKQEYWLKIANRVNEVLSQEYTDGVVITHGTDTLEETAYFLNLVVKSNKPVVLVGSMRPSTSLSADGNLNLFNAVALASSDEAYAKGALVLLNDNIYAARDVTKTHTTNVASFSSPNAGPIGQVHYGKVKIYYEPLRKHTARTIFDVKKLQELPKVEIAYVYAGQDAKIIDDLVNSGTKAIVTAGVGDGNVSEEVEQSLIKASKQGVLIVRSSRLNGVVIPDSEINDSELGFVSADNLSPQKARILTMLALTKTSDVKEIRKMFAVY